MHIIKALRSGKKIYYHKSFTNRLGWCTFSPVHDVSRTGTYICKYIMKQFQQGQKLDYGSHRYYVSKGLQQPVKVDLEHSRNMFRNQFLMSEVLRVSEDKAYNNRYQKSDFYYKMVLPGGEMQEFLKKVRGFENVEIV